jgi:hypothetical protein
MAAIIQHLSYIWHLRSFYVIILSQDAPFDIDVFLNSGSEQYCVNEDDITGSVILHCPATAEDEISGSVLMKQACVTIGHEEYDIPFANNGNYSPTLNSIFYFLFVY